MKSKGDTLFIVLFLCLIVAN